MGNHQVLQELKTTLDAWIAETEECDFVDDNAGCPLRKLLLKKKRTIERTLERDEHSDKR